MDWMRGLSCRWRLQTRPVPAILAVALAGCAELNLPDLLASPAPATKPVRVTQVAAPVAAATASAPVAVTAKPAAPPPAGPVLPPKAVIAYGSGPLQFGELRLPPGDGPFPVAVLIHGGCWTSGFATLRSTAALASELTRFGIASWNIEYRQRGDAGGGWPGTYRDWAAALDQLRQLQYVHPLDLSRVVAVGHSAGGHAALWLAGRAQLPADSEIRGADPLPLLAAVDIDGPADLASFIGPDQQACGEPAVAPLMGGLPDVQPQRYRQASPQSLLPLRVPQYLVSAAVLLPEAAQAYQARARALGDEVELLSLPGVGHYDPLQPGLPAGEAVRRLIVERAFTPPFSTSSVNYRCATGKRLSAAYLNLRGGESFAVLSWQGRQEVLRAGPGGSGVRYAALPGAPAGSPSAGLIWQTQGTEGMLNQELGQTTRTLAFDCKPER